MNILDVIGTAPSTHPADRQSPHDPPEWFGPMPAIEAIEKARQLPDGLIAVTDDEGRYLGWRLDPAWPVPVPATTTASNDPVRLQRAAELLAELRRRGQDATASQEDIVPSIVGGIPDDMRDDLVAYGWSLSILLAHEHRARLARLAPINMPAWQSETEQHQGTKDSLPWE